MTPLRFCMITTFYPPYSFGGDAVFVQRLAGALGRRGHEVDVIHCRDSYRSLAGRHEPPPEPTQPGVTVHGLESRVGRLSPLATQQTGQPWFKRRRIEAILRARQPEVIHYHNISLVGGPGVLALGAAIKLYTLHEHWLVCPTHVLFKFKREPCREKECLRCQLSYRRPPQWWRYTDLLSRAVRQVDAFLAPSETVRQRHAAEFPELPLVRLPHFLGTPPAPAPVPGLPARPYFLFVGRLEKLKGLQTIIPLIRQHPAFDLVIAGAGDYAPALRQLAGDCERVHFVGRLTQAQLQTAYAGALAMLLPTIGFEVFPMVFLEACAAGTPVIVTDVGPLPGLVRESGGGLVYQDEAGLVAALTRLQGEAGLRAHLGQAGQAAWRAQWSEEAHLEKYFQLIQQIGERRG